MRGKTAKRLHRLATLQCTERSIPHKFWSKYYRAMKRWWQTLPRPLRGGVGKAMRDAANAKMEAEDANNA